MIVDRPWNELDGGEAGSTPKMALLCRCLTNWQRWGKEHVGCWDLTLASEGLSGAYLTTGSGL